MAPPAGGSNQQNGEEIAMNLQGHINELRRRHKMLDVELAEAMNHPSVEDIVIHDLKRRKLELKDEIARLSKEPVH